MIKLDKIFFAYNMVRTNLHNNFCEDLHLEHHTIFKDISLKIQTTIKFND